MAEKVLLVAYDFHPFIGGGGSIRMIKLAKYLTRLGVEVHVLTGGFESSSADPTNETQLEGVQIHVANPRPVKPSGASSSHQPGSLRLAGRLFRSILPFPDNRFRFIPHMFKACSHLIKELAPMATVVTIPPNSMGLLVPLLRKRFPEEKLILDVRDMWALDPLLTPDNKWFRWTQKKVEHFAVSKADAIVAVTEGYGEWYSRLLGPSSNVRVIHNGYDEEDFSFPFRTPLNERCVIGYAGSLGGINGPRTIRHLMESLVLLFNRRKDLCDKLEFKFIGNAGVEERQHVGRLGLDSYVNFVGFQPHKTALLELSGCNGLLLNHFALPFCDIIYPGKLFEYLRLGRPMLACTPPGLLPEFISRHRIGEVAPFDEPDVIADQLECFVDNLISGSRCYNVNAHAYSQYERSRQAQSYLKLIHEL